MAVQTGRAVDTKPRDAPLPKIGVIGMSGGSPVSKAEMFRNLSSMGGEIPPRLKAKIVVPENMYMKADEDGAEVVFRETATPLATGDLVATIRGERRITQRVVAIVPHENQAWFVYVDPSRNINFSHRLGGIQSDHFGWNILESKL